MHILIVEDEKGIVDFLKQGLEEENYTLKSYLKDKNHEKDYQIYLKNLDNHFEFER